jgi:hypothetical protein
MASPFTSRGGNLAGPGTTSVRDTIVAEGAADDQGFENCAAPVTSQGYNLEDRNQCGFGGGGDLPNRNPLLGPLQDNGGSTDTRAITSASPAFNAGLACVATDQRGVTRPQGAACDIGAFELEVGPGGGDSGGGGGGAGGGSTVTAAVSRLGVSPSVFPAAASGPSALTARRRTTTRKTGAKVSYTLNEPAAVRFTVQQTQPGRKTGKGKKARCVPQTKKNRKAKKCTRVVTLRGSFAQNGKAGANSFRFTGRLAGKKLPPGRYTLVVTPTANGKTGRAVSTPFRIIK